MRLSGNTILITGGTAGIGRAMAAAFHARGNQVVITGRREASLASMVAQYPGMRSVVMDMEDAAAIKRVAAQLASEYPQLNILINNAGIMPSDPRSVDEPSQTDAIVHINLLGPILLIEALLPTLKKQADAALINVTSGAAFVPMARFATYCATKAALHSYSVSLRHNLRNTPVQVIEMIPPYVRTELTGPAQAEDPNAMPVAEFIEEIFQLLEASPDSDELVVERIKFARHAERDGTFDDVFKNLNSWVDASF